MQQHVYSISHACEQFGVQHAIICPGSRSAPLVSAFTQSRIQCISILDERVAAYTALGIAQQSNRPVVLICTSGSAAINFYPGIAEAFYQRVPLVVLTADRPIELLNQQDGQMIVQENLYGPHVLSFATITCYQRGKENLNKVFGQTIEALKIASNPNRRGPVHLNVPLSEPLYSHEKIKHKPAFNVTVKLSDNSIDSNHVNLLRQYWETAKRKMILLGQMPVNNEMFTQLLRIEQDAQVVILSDVLSNQQVVSTAPFFDTLLMKSSPEILDKLKPDLLVSLGGPVLSKALKIWLQSQPELKHVRVDASGIPIDTYKNLSFTVKQNPVSVLASLSSQTEVEQSDFKKTWSKLDELTQVRLDHFLHKSGMNELAVTNEILKFLPTASNLHIANSSVIRYISWLGGVPNHVMANGNRGTSGIDGCVSTAIGAARVNNRQTVLITGDLAFFYDRNALWQQPIPENVKIVVLNNYGGGIFKLIDGPKSHKEHISFFTTPHQYAVKQAADEYQMEYYFCDSMKTLAAKLATFFEPSSKASILEIKIEMDKNAKAFELFKKIQLI